MGRENAPNGGATKFLIPGATYRITGVHEADALSCVRDVLRGMEVVAMSGRNHSSAPTYYRGTGRFLMSAEKIKEIRSCGIGFSKLSEMRSEYEWLALELVLVSVPQTEELSIDM